MGLYIPLYYNFGVVVDTLSDPEYIIIEGDTKEVRIKDDDLKPNSEGKYIANIVELRHSNRFPGIVFPDTAEIPADILEERARLKRLDIFGKVIIGIDWSKKPEIYFYLDDCRLQAVQGEKVVYADEIVLTYGRKTINIEAFGLKHKFLELPEDIIQIFEKVLSDKEMESLCLIPVGESLLDGEVWYRLSLDIPPERFNWVKDLFEFYTGDEPWQGQLTKNPAKVSQILGIPIKGE
jgi:hypothetical protein